MNKKILIFLFSFTPFYTNLNAQGVDNYWLTGYEKSGGLPWGPTMLDFRNGTPTIYYDSIRTMSLNFALASISDSLNNLLFYTNGVWIANALGDTILNGDSINPSNYTTQQGLHDKGLRITASSLVLPFPNHPSQYILIHETDDDATTPYPFYLFYSIIDMKNDSGKGEVISKNQIILNDTLGGGQIVACRHANGRDWWIVVPEKLHTNYYVILLTPDGPSINSLQTIGTRISSTGQACFSPDGTTYASYDTYADLEVYDFDRCAGVFTNPRHVAINDNMVGFGIAFSPDSRKIYCSSTELLYQFDLDKPNLADYDTVAIWDGFYSPQPPFATMFFTQALRQDGKIYINSGNTTFHLHTIDSPDSSGMACNVIQHSTLLPTYNSSTCPTNTNYFLGPVTGSICDSLIGIKDNDAFEKAVKLYPNPASSSFYLSYEFDYNVNGWVELYDLQGRMVFKQRLYWSTKQLLLHADKFVNGIYAVRVRDEMGNRVTKKLVIQH